MARPREFDEDRVLNALMEVFWEKGFEATSMQDLVAATGMLKGSLYGAFGDKQALYRLALERYDKVHLQAGIDALAKPGSVTERISRLFDAVLDSLESRTFAGGCLLCNASMEMASIDSGVQGIVARQISRLHRAIIGAIAALNLTDESADALAGYIVTTYFGARVIAKSGMPRGIIEATRDRCLASVLASTEEA